MGLRILLNKAAQGIVPLTNRAHSCFPSSVLIVLGSERMECRLPLSLGARLSG